MTDRHPTSLPTPAEDAALEAALGPLFDQTASQASAETLARLTAHATALPSRPRGLAPLQAMALAAVALLAVYAAQWMPAPVGTPAQLDPYETLDEVSWLDSDELGGDFDLLVLSTHTDDPETAIATIDALIAELDDDA